MDGRIAGSLSRNDDLAVRAALVKAAAAGARLGAAEAAAQLSEAGHRVQVHLDVNDYDLWVEEGDA
jgi:hypothetical protein